MNKLIFSSVELSQVRSYLKKCCNEMYLSVVVLHNKKRYDKYRSLYVKKCNKYNLDLNQLL